MYFVYLIRCRGDTLYAGITTDLPRRMRQHRGELPGGAKYTRSHPALALEAAWRAADRSAASKLEAQLKRRSHAEKLALIAHPEQLADYVPLDAAALAAAYVKVEVPADWATAEDVVVDHALEGKPELVKQVKDLLFPIDKMDGDSLPVSAFLDHVDGQFELGARLEAEVRRYRDDHRFCLELAQGASAWL